MEQDQREEKRLVNGDGVYCRESKKTLASQQLQSTMSSIKVSRLCLVAEERVHSNVSTLTCSVHYSYTQYCIRAAQCTVVLKACFWMCMLLFVSKREDFVVIGVHFIKITDHLSIMSAQNTIMKHTLIPDKACQYYHKIYFC